MKFITTAILAAAASTMLVACSDENAARKALVQQGYTDIQITGHAFFACSEDDSFSTGFVAVSMAGHRVEGVVCSGLFGKGATIRTF